MMIQINGNTYKNATLDVNALCDFEEMGISVDTITKKPLSLARAYLALCMNADAKAAGEEIAKHMSDGGKLDVILDAFKEEVDKSDFFRSLKEKQETENSESKKQENS